MSGSRSSGLNSETISHCWLPSRRLSLAVLHPDDRNRGRASLLDDGADVCDDGVPVVGSVDDAVLHVDDEECGIRAVLECRHGLSLLA